MNAMPAAARTDGRSAPSDGFDALDEAHRRILDVTGQLEALVTALGYDEPDAAQRKQAAEIAEFYAAHVRTHHADEEKYVFPPLLRGSPEVVQAVLRLQQDHGWLEEDWLELEPHLQSLATGFGSCDRDLLRNGVEIFVALLRDHVALEESLIYPEAKARLGDGTRRAMGREMSERRRRERHGGARQHG